MTWTALVLMMLHVVEVLLWALAYLLFLPGDHLDSFEKAAYFSVVTFTTLGYGDITLVEHEWRLLSGIEALDGILLVGWTTACCSWSSSGVGGPWRTVMAETDETASILHTRTRTLEMRVTTVIRGSTRCRHS